MLLLQLSENKKQLIKTLFKKKQPNNSALYCYFEGSLPGKTYVDNLEAPTKAICKLDMSWTYISDDADLPWIEKVLKEIIKETWIQVVWPPYRKGKYPEIQGGNAFGRLEYIERTAPKKQARKIDIRSYSSELFDKLPADMKEWHIMNYGSKEEFLKKASGFYAITNGEICCESEVAFSARGYAELGIITLEQFRKQGYAYAVCLRTLEELDKKGVKGIWACDADNIASSKLAEQLGFINPVEYDFIYFPQKE